MRSWRNIQVVALLFCIQISNSVPKSLLLDKIAKNKTASLGILIPWSEEWEVGQYMGAAVGVGIRTIQQKGLLPGYVIQWEWADTRCKSLSGLKAALDLMDGFNGKLNAFIGGGCSVVCTPVALVSAAKNIPQISWGCNSNALSSKFNYPTFTRSVGTWPMLATMFDQLASRFYWDRLGIIATPEAVMQLTLNAIKAACQRSNKTVIARTIESTVEGSVTNKELLEKQRAVISEMKRSTHVFIIVMYDNDIRNFLLNAFDEGMFDGKHVFITIDASLDKINSPQRPKDVRYSYEGLISANLRVPRGREWGLFAKEVIKEFQLEPKFQGYPKLQDNATIDMVDAHAGMLHDALLMWAYGANATLQQGGSINDGINVTKNIFNLTFEGKTGTVAINAEGDRKPDYTVTMIQNGQFVKLMDWIAADDRLVKIYNDHGGTDNWTGLIWAGGQTRPPIGRPDCGWDGEYCQVGVIDKHGKWVTVWIPVMVGVFVFLIIVIAAILFRKMKYEQQLKSALWKIHWNEIHRHDLKRNGSMYASRIGKGNNSRISMRSTKSAVSFASEKYHFTDVGKYRGKIVAIKYVDKTSVNTQDREILKELKSMREVIHDNVNLFIGACVDSRPICVIMAYAQKGSLQDVINNDAVTLTWDFKLSFATDIAAGMAYLHSTPISSHGRLTSSNVIVDSRWSCKITDYGLALFKAPESSFKSHYETVYVQADLWKAPELLRLNHPHSNGTKEGDVFSYGIILQEIVLQGEPYCANLPDLELEGIVMRVMERCEPFYRPHVPTESCNAIWRNVMQACWLEDPGDRPIFMKVRQQLRLISGGKSVNVIDNMINLLEKHAEKMEDLVAERTEELQAEKKKVENLLYNILPRSVADDLKQGKHVQPESFDSVTIYFSDIVGFTNLAAASTPLQVVDLLNSLYSTFDDVTDQFDVYKVETIGDAYMVTSGLPVRNNDRHAAEIAQMSLQLLHSISSFTIPHLSDRLKLRIGLHSGPCVAGVVGSKMPRYCLFGDTVNTASRMESTGEALKIHMSQSTVDLLNSVGGFHMQTRGEIDVKGKGSMVTYWLLGSDNKTISTSRPSSARKLLDSVLPGSVPNSPSRGISNTNPFSDVAVTIENTKNFDSILKNSPPRIQNSPPKIQNSPLKIQNSPTKIQNFNQELNNLSHNLSLKMNNAKVKNSDGVITNQSRLGFDNKAFEGWDEKEPNSFPLLNIKQEMV